MASACSLDAVLEARRGLLNLDESCPYSLSFSAQKQGFAGPGHVKGLAEPDFLNIWDLRGGCLQDAQSLPLLSLNTPQVSRRNRALKASSP